MLKALELFGFKSFADRTRFEFPRGITAIVGPNGSGKSNVVDAIKWVLGEQSVKSLRGQEMADVIFNGSSTRRPMNAAEITLVLDNSSGILPIEASEVAITRRFYRDGEGEYLLNYQPCRLRDIRDLLGGTGLGTSAYCVIEQGKVDSLLQASDRDRRIIFEEAAGISRFKAKRAEALRRLERVEQNLLRLRDIVEEVESRLRTLRIQAGRARRYRELESQLQAHRTQLAVADWHAWSAQLESLRAKEAELAQAAAELREEMHQAEQSAAHWHDRIRQAERQIREEEARAAAARAQVQALWDRLEAERRQLTEIDQQLEQLRQGFRQTVADLTALQGQLDQSRREHESSLSFRDKLAAQLAEGERYLSELGTQLEQFQQCYERLREESANLSQKQSQLDREAAVIRTRLEGLAARIAELGDQEAYILRALETLEAEDRQTQAQRQALGKEVATLDQQLAEKRTQLSDREAEAARKREELSQSEKQLAASTERIALLEELLARFEGVSPGVQYLLREKQAAPEGPLRHVFGLLADGISAASELARLVEIALAGKSHFLVAQPAEELITYLLEARERLEGPAEILWVDNTPDWPPVRTLSLDGHPGVIGRLDTLVETVPEVAPIVRRLLSGTWVIDRLERAILLRQNLGSGVSFITLAGEWVGGDGTLVLGPPRWVPGILSRRTELKTLQEGASQLRFRIGLLSEELGNLSAETRVLADAIEHLRSERTHLLGKVAAIEQSLREIAEKKQQLACQLDRTREEKQDLVRQHQEAQQLLEALTAESHVFQEKLRDLERQMEEVRRAQEDYHTRRIQADSRVAELREELKSLSDRLTRQAGELGRLQRLVEAAGESQNRLVHELANRAEFRQRRELEILRLEAELTQAAYLAEVFARRLNAQKVNLAWLEGEQEACRQTIAHLRSRSQAMEEERHQLQLAIGQLTAELGHLEARFREDYGQDLAQIARLQPQGTHIDRDAIGQQIEELRRKIKSLGSVNLEALSELDQVEARYQELASQYQDLVRAKDTFHRILDRINAASREVFLKTIEEVRVHFADLFRTLFGGGHADILLEEGVDPLEAGVEIVARPPGKEPRSISLLSGGEKTLASVALLLAIFRSRPSPFCVLDEVDAALDEANIDRFIKLLQDFPGCSQFILITHSKKTMTCAQTIYGVTMQEAGVSRQVSVRFEDITKEDWSLASSVPAGAALTPTQVGEPALQTEAA
ncbi:MAG: chromosome segregation protein SMC [Thermoguttaceae bacterium]|nr:chromosome segregation protein SMC [Thermoguttaceae bacterium]MDW8080052.1 chromosome segregation protein SMC [Thermoguttaceae bacterium]